ncbi:MAG: DUF3084 domain-containing protein, partial [Selenomonadaceae bacterium]|nr:DUF3084 domain-containing protein [Selenomonadaceae bacterium]
MNATLAELDEATGNLLKAQTEFERANENLRESKLEIAALKDEQETLRNEQEELRAESDRLKAGNEQLESTNAELAAQNENLSGANAALEADNKKLGEFNVTLTADNEKLSSANNQLSADNTELENRNQRLREGIIAIREGDITLRAGEVLASGIIRGGRNGEEISADINAIADRATQSLIERFGGDADNSVWIYQPELQRVIGEIESSGRDMVLRISAAGNLVRGEPVRTRLEVYPNQKIFRKGEQILVKNYKLGGDDAPELILQDFLTEINRIAIDKGILSDPLTGSVGRMEGTQLYEVLDTLIDAKGTVQLTASAREETDSQGPLRLNISVKKV